MAGRYCRGLHGKWEGNYIDGHVHLTCWGLSESRPRVRPAFVSCSRPVSAVSMSITCPFCPLRCDDVVVRAEGKRVIPEGLDCSLAVRGFERVSYAAEVLLASNHPGEMSPAVARLVDRLTDSAPVSISGTMIDIGTARAAVRLAAASGGVIDAVETISSGAMRRAVERDGIVAATLAEVRQRADSVVMIGDPSEEYPRLLERFLAAGPAPLAGQRRFLSIGEARIAGLPTDRYRHIPVGLGDTHRVLAEARGGIRVGRSDASGVADWLREGHYTAWLWASDVVDALTAGVLVGLVADLNRERRAVAVPLGSDATLRSVATWLTGLSGPVDFSGGWPQLLEQPVAASTAIWLQPHPTAPPPPLGSDFLAVIGMADAELVERADLYIPCGAPGIDVAGSTYRGDGTVCLPLHAPRDSGLPSPAEVLLEIAARLADRIVEGNCERTEAGATEVGNPSC